MWQALKVMLARMSLLHILMTTQRHMTSIQCLLVCCNLCLWMIQNPLYRVFCVSLKHIALKVLQLMN